MIYGTIAIAYVCCLKCYRYRLVIFDVKVAGFLRPDWFATPVDFAGFEYLTRCCVAIF